MDDLDQIPMPWEDPPDPVTDFRTFIRLTTVDNNVILINTEFIMMIQEKSDQSTFKYTIVSVGDIHVFIKNRIEEINDKLKDLRLI